MSVTHSIIIADNQDLTRAGLHVYAARFAYGSPITDVRDKATLVEAMERQGAGVVILDYTMFDLRSIEELLIIQKRFPRFCWVMISAEPSEGFIRRLSVEEGVSMVLKEEAEEEILAAIQAATRGESYYSPRLANLIESFSTPVESAHTDSSEPQLTPTEKEILRLIAKGLSVKDMAAERFSSTHTIITHKKNIFRKLGVNTVYEATRYAIRAGVADPLEYYI